MPLSYEAKRDILAVTPLFATLGRDDLDALATLAIGLMGAGTVPGEIALLDGCPRSLDMTAMSDTTLLVLERQAFLRLIMAAAWSGMRLSPSYHPGSSRPLWSAWAAWPGRRGCRPDNR